LNGNPVTLAAAKAAISHLRGNSGTIYPRLRQLGEKLSSGLAQALRQAGHDANTTGDGPVFTLHIQQGAPHTYRDTLKADKQAYSDFALALLDEGVQVLPDARWYISAAHTEQDIDATLAAAERAAQSIARS
jgi:glutamate-1-semialdehyde 2,1-aminomutase